MAYIVTFDPDNGDPTIDVSVNYNETAVMPRDPEKPNCIFSGWYTEHDGQGTEFTSETRVKYSFTVYAYWINGIHDVTFDPDNGDPTITVQIPHGGTTDRPSPDPVKQGYYFDDWYYLTDGEGFRNFTRLTVINKDMTVTAHWMKAVAHEVDLGVVTAYGNALQGGYEGTFEGFCAALKKIGDIASGSVTSFNTRIGDVISADGDYDAEQVTALAPDKTTKTDVQDAINVLNTKIGNTDNKIDTVAGEIEQEVLTKMVISATISNGKINFKDTDGTILFSINTADIVGDIISSGTTEYVDGSTSLETGKIYLQY